MTITQFKALSSPTIRLSLVATNGNIKSKLVVTVALEHLVQWDIEQSLYIRATYFYAGSMPTAFIAIPPFRTNEGNAAPPVLALRMSSV